MQVINSCYKLMFLHKLHVVSILAVGVQVRVMLVPSFKHQRLVEAVVKVAVLDKIY